MGLKVYAFVPCAQNVFFETIQILVFKNFLARK